ncbi:hypothetical protein STRDD10_00409 [Streptococcus sp. DD10]|uniref:hypothetical protein n=1 Tax=Streptococcus sp. DD10 TaxID=1777878 RepID=UPI0007938B93|nr:hypothetical protein [Streptococcus sp. DD10]KXT75173.1 hypothetical protein STRDD10_00409 [Streptococcus sp. DD10]
MVTQGQFKSIKRQVVEETAVGVGYYEGILQEIPSYALLEAVREVSSLGWITPHTSDADIQNMLVTESVKNMGYQDFKEVAPYFFSYPKTRAEMRLIEPIEVSPSYFEKLQANATELFNLKQELQEMNQNIEDKIQELETNRLPNGDEVVGIDLEAEELLLLHASENRFIEADEVILENTITDYRSQLSESGQVIEYLLDEENPQLTTILYEEVIHHYHRHWPDTDPIQFTEEMIEVLNREGKLDASYYQTANFNSLRDAYAYGSRSIAFDEKFPDYDSFVLSYAEDKEVHEEYDYQFEAVAIAEDIIANRLEDINQVLSNINQELIIETVTGYSQGDSWQLAYMRDTEQETAENVRDYLQHELGAWYRGSLTELSVISFDNIDIDKGFNGEVELTTRVDSDLLYGDKLKQLQERMPELARFSPTETAIRSLVREVQENLQEPEMGL